MKRKPRHKIKLTDDMTMRPLDITMFGSEDDPCFGKFHDAKAKECKRCGDNEVCAIVLAQRMHSKRAIAESTMVVHDKNEKNLDLMTLDKFVHKTLLKNNPIRFKNLLKLTVEHFSKFEPVSPAVESMLVDYVKRAAKYKKYTKNGKRMLKLIA